MRRCGIQFGSMFRACMLISFALASSATVASTRPFTSQCPAMNRKINALAHLNTMRTFFFRPNKSSEGTKHIYVSNALAFDIEVLKFDWISSC